MASVVIIIIIFILFSKAGYKIGSLFGADVNL